MGVLGGTPHTRSRQTSALVGGQTGEEATTAMTEEWGGRDSEVGPGGVRPETPVRRQVWVPRRQQGTGTSQGAVRAWRDRGSSDAGGGELRQVGRANQVRTRKEGMEATASEAWWASSRSSLVAAT